MSFELVWARLTPPTLRELASRLESIDLEWNAPVPHDLLTFYHPSTLAELCAVRDYLLRRRSNGTSDALDDWIRMITLNRLTGHPPGFLSVYTLPPNQAVSVRAQRKINADRGQTPPRRKLRDIVIRKSAALLADVDEPTRERLRGAEAAAWFHVGTCTEPFAEAESVQLIVTSPPFLDVVNYASDNWLRCWFCGIVPNQLAIGVHQTLEAWRSFIADAFKQFERLLMPGGFVAFEVGEVRRGSVRLEHAVIPCGIAANLEPVCILINEQRFTKTANIWGVSNNSKGTNTNRIAVFRKPTSPSQ